MTLGAALRSAVLAACSTSALILGGCATTRDEVSSLDNFSVGRNAAGELCTATRASRDPAVSGLFNPSFAITCRSVAASRTQGFVRLLRDDEAVAAVESSLACGEAREVAIAGGGTAQARRCIDRTLGGETLVLRSRKGGETVIGSGLLSIALPLQEAVRRVAGGTDSAAASSSIDVAQLAAPPSADRSGAAATDFDPAVALQQGIALNHRGLHVEASRLLNDALSRLSAGSDPGLRAELLLEAGLADSNISFTEAADQHFANAGALLASGSPRNFLVRKHIAYNALDLLNRRQFRRALAALAPLVAGRGNEQPLLDAAVLRSLNQRGGRDLSRSVAVPEMEGLYQLVLDTQANWARSVALLALGDTAASATALAAADTAFRPLAAERIDQGAILWLKARLDRQRGRLAARRGDWPLAVASFDGAIEALSRGSLARGGSGNEPAVAEMRLERATLIGQRGAPPEEVTTAYSEAVDALIEAGSPGVVTPTGLERYLDLLIADSGPAAEASRERFFRALQAVGEPAVARQISRIQTVVSADPAISGKVRERAELEREITRLRYQIADADPAGGEAVAVLERQRRTAQDRLVVLDTELAGHTALGIAEDRPASMAEIRSALQPGEVFLKIAQLNRTVYGILIAADGTQIYKIEAPAADLAKLATRVRDSIDGRLDQDRLVPFDVGASYALFRLVLGPAADRLLAARSIVLDPAGPLERLPAGVLVTDRASVERYEAGRKGGRSFDFSGVAFLAARAAVSTAVSPRSFLVARSLPPSRAAKPFIGFAEHEPPASGPRFASASPIAVGNVCSAEFEALRELATRMRPIDRQEVQIAAGALGAAGAPMLAGGEFSDSAVRARGDLDQYKVLHFATHGLEEGLWGCSKSPPALVTSFGDGNSDGLLSFDEIAALRLDANLVVLSACDTGSGIRSQSLARRLGQEEAGSTLQGLVRAFLAANSRAVLATHWEVPAREGTLDFIKGFYANARTQSIGAAMQSAQRDLIARPEVSHPFYWGAFFLVGDSSKTVLGRG
jgi:CHAT domain